MKCRICNKNPATHTILDRKGTVDCCKACVDAKRAADIKKDLKDPSFSVRCCWKVEEAEV